MCHLVAHAGDFFLAKITLVRRRVHAARDIREVGVLGVLKAPRCASDHHGALKGGRVRQVVNLNVTGRDVTAALGRARSKLSHGSQLGPFRELADTLKVKVALTDTFTNGQFAYCDVVIAVGGGFSVDGLDDLINGKICLHKSD